MEPWLSSRDYGPPKIDRADYVLDDFKPPPPSFKRCHSFPWLDPVYRGIRFSDLLFFFFFFIFRRFLSFFSKSSLSRERRAPRDDSGSGFPLKDHLWHLLRRIRFIRCIILIIVLFFFLLCILYTSEQDDYSFWNMNWRIISRVLDSLINRVSIFDDTKMRPAEEFYSISTREQGFLDLGNPSCFRFTVKRAKKSSDSALQREIGRQIEIGLNSPFPFTFVISIHPISTLLY